jgi:hypothetical protein
LCANATELKKFLLTLRSLRDWDKASKAIALAATEAEDRQWRAAENKEKYIYIAQTTKAKNNFSLYSHYLFFSFNSLSL